MNPITAFQKLQIRMLVRRANRRIERATEGQRQVLEYFARRLTGENKFSSAMKGLSFEAAQKKIQELQRFLSSQTSTIKGWKKLKRQVSQKVKSLVSANDTLRQMGYDLTDSELADIIEQLDSESRQDFYKAVNLVEAKKQTQDDWTGSADQIAAAINEKISYQAAMERAIAAQGSLNAYGYVPTEEDIPF